MDISNFGKGAQRLPSEKKAKHFNLIPRAYPPINWNVSYNVENGFKLPFLNQNGSSSCTAHATVYYCQALLKKRYNKIEDYSRRFIYSQTHLPGGGAYISDAMSIPVKTGLASEQSVPDLDSSEQTESDNTVNLNALLEGVAEKYAQLPHDASIDDLGAICEAYGGFVTGFDGQNDMFDAKGVVSIPSNPTWGHAVWVCGHTLLPDGRKALIFKNSWSAAWGDGGYGYFPEEFVKSKYLFDPYVYADVTNIMLPRTIFKPAPTSQNQYIPALGTTGRDVLVDNEGTLHTLFDLGWLPGTAVPSKVVPGNVKITISPVE